MLALEPLAQALGTSISGFFQPAPAAGPATGPGGLAVGGGVTSQIFHQGGVVGAPGAPTRQVSSSVFVHAERYHSGGIAGLRPGEVPAVLTHGERVLPPGAPVGGSMTVIINDQRSGGSIEKTERRRPGGGRELTLEIRDEVSRQLGRGDHDRALGSRFGLEPRAARR